LCCGIFPVSLIECSLKGGDRVDQKKIGAFLRELRKEKKLTQEQLVERFHITDRTVSRWENGNNMPDLSILVDLADFYDVDVREILDGERKGENMNQAEKEKMLLVAEYAEEEKNVLLKRFRIISIAGLCSMIVGFLMLTLVGFHSLPVTDYIIGLTFSFAYSALLMAVFYSTGVLAKIKRVKNKTLAKVVVVVCVAICVILFLVFLIESFS